MARTATCRDCGTTWELTQPYGRLPVWCAACRPRHTQRAIRERMRRYRERRAAQTEQEVDIARRRAARLCDRLEAEAPAFVAELIARVPPEVAGDVVDELLRRDQERAGGGSG